MTRKEYTGRKLETIRLEFHLSQRNENSTAPSNREDLEVPAPKVCAAEWTILAGVRGSALMTHEECQNSNGLAIIHRASHHWFEELTLTR
jgi:hypothetical protein